MVELVILDICSSQFLKCFNYVAEVLSIGYRVPKLQESSDLTFINVLKAIIGGLDRD
jgi:hypothetical protein